MTFGIFSIGLAQINLSFVTTVPTCYAYYDGSIDMSVTGGTFPYTYSWYYSGSLFSVQEDITGLTDGQYIIQVIDSVGLTVIDTVVLSASYQITSIDTITDANCYNAYGVININPTGGTANYQGILYPLFWDTWLQIWYIDSALIDTQYTNIDTTNFLWAALAGNYNIVIVEDSGAGCAIIKNYQIHQPSAPLSMNKTYDNIICKGDNTGWISVDPDGGTPPYYFAWSNGATTAAISTLTAGLYTVTVRDSKNCVVSETISIKEPFQDLIMISDTQAVSCRDNQDGYAEITMIENGLPPYTYQWSTGSMDTYISDLDSGYYSITVTDANNCVVTDTFHIGMINRPCIIIYNVITPDGNGKNDTWIIKNIHLYPDAEVQVFNRWGKMVFSKSNGYDDSWDGDDLNSGDYYYVVKLNYGDYPPYTGPLKILK